MPTQEIQDLITTLQQQLLIRYEEEKTVAIADGSVICNICSGKYTYAHKAKHFRTQKHKTAEIHLDAIKRIARSKTLIARTGQY